MVPVQVPGTQLLKPQEFLRDRNSQSVFCCSDEATWVTGMGLSLEHEVLGLLSFFFLPMSLHVPDYRINGITPCGTLSLASVT